MSFLRNNKTLVILFLDSCRETLESYISELQKLAMTLFGFMAKALKIGKSEMEEMFGDGMQSMRMTYYPPCPQPQKVMGLTAHSDATVITILLQLNGVEGLQVKRDGNWIPVSILPNAFVVNVGDILEVCHTFSLSNIRTNYGKLYFYVSLFVKT